MMIGTDSHTTVNAGGLGMSLQVGGADAVCYIWNGLGIKISKLIELN
jgi:aconitase A